MKQINAHCLEMANKFLKEYSMHFVLKWMCDSRHGQQRLERFSFMYEDHVLRWMCNAREWHACCQINVPALRAQNSIPKRMRFGIQMEQILREQPHERIWKRKSVRTLFPCSISENKMILSSRESLHFSRVCTDLL